MTAQTVGAAVAVRQKQDQIVDWVRSQQDEIAMVAATHIKPSSVVRVVHGALRRNPKLMAAAIANPTSLLSAMLEAARLGHEPDTDDYYLVPFGQEVTGIEGYKGIIERMYRAGAVSSVVAEIVRQKDIYRKTGATTPPLHEFDDFADPDSRGPLRGAYAYAIFRDGQCSKVIRMGRAEIMKHKAKSRGSNKDDSPWQQWEESMWLKTVLRALEPYVPTSTEYRTPGHLLTAQGAAELSQRMGTPGALKSGDPVPDDVVEGVIVDEPAPPAETPSSSVPKREAAPRKPSAGATEKLQRLLKQVPLGDEADVKVFVEWVTGHPADADPSAADVTNLSTMLDDALHAADGDGEQAASSLWEQHQQATNG